MQRRRTTLLQVPKNELAHLTHTPFFYSAKQLRLEYFVAASVLVLVFLVLVLVAVAVLLIRVFRKRIGLAERRRRKAMGAAAAAAAGGNGSSLDAADGGGGSLGAATTVVVGSGGKVAPAASGRMPKHIQMGTGFMTTVSASSSSSDRPDLISDHQVGPK